MSQFYSTCQQIGRTEWMLNQLIDSVIDGQPKCVVVGHNYNFFCNNLIPRIVDKLKENNINYTLYRDHIECDGSVIYFRVAEDLHVFLRGTRGFGVFWDHYVYDRLVDYLERRTCDRLAVTNY